MLCRLHSTGDLVGPGDRSESPGVRIAIGFPIGGALVPVGSLFGVPAGALFSVDWALARAVLHCIDVLDGFNGGFPMVLSPFLGGAGIRPLNVGGDFRGAVLGVGDFYISAQFGVLGGFCYSKGIGRWGSLKWSIRVALGFIR